MKTRQRSIIERVGGYILIVVAAGAFGAFYTQNNASQKKKISALKEQIVKKKEERDASVTQLEDRKKIHEKWKNALSALQSKLNTEFTQPLKQVQGDYTDFIRAVQQKADTYRIKIYTSKYDPPAAVQKAPANLMEFKFHMDIVGSYEKMKQFLWEIENNMGRIAKIAKMTIRPPICDAEGNMRLSLTLATFFPK